MRPEDKEAHPRTTVTLRNGAEAVLRPLSIQDGRRLGDFYETVPRDDFRFYRPHPLDRAHAMANAADAHSALEAAIVMETPDGEIAGYAWCRWQDHGAEKSNFGICIRRDYQGIGAGAKLIGRLLEIVRAVGPPVVSLTVQKANARALSLYRRCGFQVVREQMRPEDTLNGFAAESEYYMEQRLRQGRGSEPIRARRFERTDR